MRFEHPFDLRDMPAAQANRDARAAAKGKPLGVESRLSFDAKKMAIPAAGGVTVKSASVGGVSGYWCQPANALPKACILFLHGGGYILGTAQAFTNFAGQIASRAGANTFVADYRLAPEHRFPAAIDDAIAAYKGLVAQGFERIAVAGDSAGGGLALALLAKLGGVEDVASVRPAAAAVMSPWVDLTLTAESYLTRAEADPVFTREVLQAIVNTYLGDEDPTNPVASPLFGSLKGLPPIRIDVGNDEVLLDDAVRYAMRAFNEGVSVSVNIWRGMPHVFQNAIGRYVAAGESLNAIGCFLRERLSPKSAPVTIFSP